MHKPVGGLHKEMPARVWEKDSTSVILAGCVIRLRVPTRRREEDQSGQSGARATLECMTVLCAGVIKGTRVLFVSFSPGAVLCCVVNFAGAAPNPVHRARFKIGKSHQPASGDPARQGRPTGSQLRTSRNGAEQESEPDLDSLCAAPST